MKMSVAKSYEKYELLDEPYKKDGRPYVHIQYPCCKRKSCTKCGGTGGYAKEVRWYGEVKNSSTTTNGFNARAAFLFGEKGFITIFKGNAEDIENYFLNALPKHYGRFNTLFGWFIGAETAIPTSLPTNIIPVCLKWEEVSTNNVINNYDDMETIARDVVRILSKGNVAMEDIMQLSGKTEEEILKIKEEMEIDKAEVKVGE